MERPAIVAEDLQKAYGEIRAVRGVSFQVAYGEVFGLLGPNGAGKTTTIGMMTGIVEPDRGRVVIDGVDLWGDPTRAKRKVGIVPQELALYPTLSGRDNVLFFGRLYGLRGRHLRERVDEVLELVGLTARADDAVRTYSGGMKRRLNIAAGLVHKPEIVFLDEPTVGVDPQSRNAIFEGVEKLAAEGVAVVYTTHYMEEAQRLCHRVAIMDEGRIVALDTPRALIRSVGGGLLVVRVPEGQVEAMKGMLARHPAVIAVDRRDGVLHVRVHQTQEGLAALLSAVGEVGGEVNSLEVLEPNLESVFLHLTGKYLRD